MVKEDIEKCLLCGKKINKGSSYSICYDSDWKINVRDGDTHKYIGYLCISCGKKIKRKK